MIASELQLKTPPNQISQKLRESANAVVEEVLTPTQKERMRQIVFRIEVSVLGLAAALTEGRLQGEVGVHENQFTSIRERGANIEARARADILKVLMRAEAELLAELIPEQRKSAESALGEFFIYSNVKDMQRILGGLREKENAKETESGKNR